MVNIRRDQNSALISTKDINGKPLTGRKYPQSTSITYILKINIPKGDLRKRLGKGSTPTEISK